MTGGQEVYFTPWLYHPFFSLTSVALGPAGKRSPEPAVRELSLTEWASLKCWQEEGPWRDEAPDCSPAVSTQCLLKCEQQRSSHHPPRCWVELLLFRTPFPAPPSPPPPPAQLWEFWWTFTHHDEYRGTLGLPTALWPGRFVLSQVLPGLLVDTPGLFLGHFGLRASLGHRRTQRL